MATNSSKKFGIFPRNVLAFGYQRAVSWLLWLLFSIFSFPASQNFHNREQYKDLKHVVNIKHLVMIKLAKDYNLSIKYYKASKINIKFNNVYY